MYIWIYIYMYVYICICAYMYIWICVYVYILTYSSIRYGVILYKSCEYYYTYSIPVLHFGSAYKYIWICVYSHIHISDKDMIWFEYCEYCYIYSIRVLRFGTLYMRYIWRMRVVRRTSSDVCVMCVIFTSYAECVLCISLALICIPRCITWR